LQRVSAADGMENLPVDRAIMHIHVL